MTNFQEFGNQQNIFEEGEFITTAIFGVQNDFDQIHPNSFSSQAIDFINIVGENGFDDKLETSATIEQEIYNLYFQSRHETITSQSLSNTKSKPKIQLVTKNKTKTNRIKYTENEEDSNDTDSDFILSNSYETRSGRRTRKHERPITRMSMRSTKKISYKEISENEDFTSFSDNSEDDQIVTKPRSKSSSSCTQNDKTPIENKIQQENVEFNNIDDDLELSSVNNKIELFNEYNEMEKFRVTQDSIPNNNSPFSHLETAGFRKIDETQSFTFF